MKTVLFLLVLGFSRDALPQVLETPTEYFITAGWSFSKGDYSGLNKLVENYNSSRFLDKEMKPFSFLHGPLFAIGYCTPRILSELQFSWSHNEQTAKGADSTGSTFTEKLDFRHNTLKLSLGLGGNLNTNILLHVGGSVDMGFANLRFRSWNDNESKPQWVKLGKQESVFGSTFFVDLRDSASLVSVRLYYHIDFNNSDFNPENKQLNHSGFYDLDLASTQRSFGITIQTSIAGACLANCFGIAYLFFLFLH
jgi:hypothetical protein